MIGDWMTAAASPRGFCARPMTWVQPSYDLPHMPTLPVDQGCDAAHSTARFVSICSPGPPKSLQPWEPPKPRRSA